MLGQLGIIFMSVGGAYLLNRHIKSSKYKVEKLWNKVILNFHSQNSIRNVKGQSFRLAKIQMEGDVVTGRLYIPFGLSINDFEKLIPALENAFYGKIEVTSNHYIRIETGRNLEC